MLVFLIKAFSKCNMIIIRAPITNKASEKIKAWVETFGPHFLHAQTPIWLKELLRALMVNTPCFEMSSWLLAGLFFWLHRCFQNWDGSGCSMKQYKDKKYTPNQLHPFSPLGLETHNTAAKSRLQFHHLNSSQSLTDHLPGKEECLMWRDYRISGQETYQHQITVQKICVKFHYRPLVQTLFFCVRFLLRLIFLLFFVSILLIFFRRISRQWLWQRCLHRAELRKYVRPSTRSRPIPFLTATPPHKSVKPQLLPA